jgi:beta-phosphoglucomutase-like phosphatase (HAD superfamily)
MRRTRTRAAERSSAVLLDLDGCLIDSNDAHARAWSDALRKFGRRVAASRIRIHIGKGGREMLRDFVTPAEHAILAPAMGSVQNEIFLSRFAREVRPFPGAAAAVRSMAKAGIRVVLASSADPAVVERATRLLRIEEALSGATTADDVEKTKPFEDVFSLAIARYRLAGRRPMAVGDTPYDIAAAHQIGVPCAALRSGGFPAKRLACADHLFADLAALWRDGRELFA